MKRPSAPMSGSGGDDYSGPKSPLRVMHIVELLAAATNGMSLAAMTEALQIPKTSLLNHLRVMVGAGYVSLRDARYALGPAALRLGAIIAADAGVLAAARPVAAELMLRTGETVMLATLDERSAEALYLDVIYSQQDIRYSPRVGSRWPLYCTGMGRALLAFQEPSFIHRYLAETDMLRRTPRTVTERTRLRRIIDEVRGSGVVVTQGEHTIGAGAVAAPVIERDGRVRHAIGIGVPIDRLEPRRELLAALVTEAAREVSWTLGGHAAPPSKFAPQDSGNSTSSLAAAPLKRTSKARQGERRPA
ncbi:IclR family transcriptional regulator [Caenimonas sedimenti]|uniref:IclR family transcriptional regulator n=2 Tax=Caenimonas sedimenti TaxID=2596921 RepID=A0A562ZS18_9BURK|nr:IclR family transcriptional regulator [Caenimonas sedimenti]